MMDASSKFALKKVTKLLEIAKWLLLTAHKNSSSPYSMVSSWPRTTYHLATIPASQTDTTLCLSYNR